MLCEHAAMRGGILEQIGAKIHDPRRAPAIEQGLEGAVVFEPERDRRRIEQDRRIDETDAQVSSAAGARAWRRRTTLNCA